MSDQSDEDVVERWVENPYWQQFCGMSDFQWQLPCDPSDLVYFRQRIGAQGVALILAVSAQMHGERAKECEVVVDSTVQEKNGCAPSREQNRPLEPGYRVVYFDALRVKIRDEGSVRNKAVYLALGIAADGTKDVLGISMSRTREPNSGSRS